MPQMFREDVLESLAWANEFARSCAIRFPGHVDRDDLRSVGVLAYLQAAARYNGALGASFRGYCAVRIRGAILDELRKWSWAPRSVHRDQRRIGKAQEELIERLQREPTRLEVADHLGVSLIELERIESQSRTRHVLSLSEAGTQNENSTLAERVPDLNVDQPSNGLLLAEDRHALLLAIRTLSKVEATVIVLHYLKEVPLSEIAVSMEVSPSRISQLHYQALARLKSYMRRQPD